MTTVTKRVPSGASGGATKRITGTITENVTRRVPTEVVGLGPFLLLEGDSEGALSFEEVSADGYLKLQGSY